MKHSVVILQDSEASIASIKRAVEELDDYLVVGVSTDGEKGIEMIKNLNPEIVVTGIILKEVDGFGVLNEIKRSGRRVKAMVVSCFTREEIIRKALALDALYYIVKPFSPREVVARIKAVLRRTNEQKAGDSDAIVHDGLVIDIKSYTVTLDNHPVICTPKEIEILYLLASNPGHVFTREQLLNKVWGYDYAGETRTVDTHIKRIRAKLDNTGKNWSIKTIYGVGYKFEVE